ncbi:MAG: mRNA surveillance protein pelota [Nitrososphaerota archaeon]|nr:mRNA surveillance protein pelota [Candidatus Bathyarchaeota archaeon]MDW8048511.1 mRNA surveillance protein pelota [Nitrososphaerota archaeon]
MRILQMDIKHDSISVLPEVLDDLWVLYNIIQKGDRVYAKTTREVKLGDRYERPEKGRRISIQLGVLVDSIIWDRYLNRLRVHGIVCECPEDIGALGSHHTLNITLDRPLRIVKNKWMQYQIDQLKKSTEKGVSPLIIIAIDDEGYCVAVLRGFGLDLKSEEKINLPGKLDSSGRQKALNELFKSASKCLENILIEEKLPIAIVGLGFIKNYFIKYLEEKKPEIFRKVIDVKSVNSVGEAGIYEAVRSGILSKAIQKLRIFEENRAVEEFLERIVKENPYATYGLLEIEKAAALGAVENMLVTDVYLGQGSGEEKQLIERLMRDVEQKGGRVTIISTGHEAGEKLNSFGGIAALLRFPLVQE